MKNNIFTDEEIQRASHDIAIQYSHSFGTASIELNVKDYIKHYTKVYELLEKYNKDYSTPNP